MREGLHAVMLHAVNAPASYTRMYCSTYGVVWGAILYFLLWQYLSWCKGVLHNAMPIMPALDSSGSPCSVLYSSSSVH